MTTTKASNGAGLRGQVAGQTAICTVGHTGAGLTYRGYDMVELAERAKFEEVAYLLMHGKLPNQQELNDYIQKLKGLRDLPDSLKAVLEKIPADTHPMDVMRTGCSMLGNLEVEQSFAEQYDKADRMLAVFPSIINYWYRYSHDGVRIDTETDDEDKPEDDDLRVGKRPSEPILEEFHYAGLFRTDAEIRSSGSTWPRPRFADRVLRW